MFTKAVRKRLFRWIILPVAAVSGFIGVAGYAYTTYQILPLRTEYSIDSGSYLPHAVYDDLWNIKYGLKKYLEYLQTGYVIDTFRPEEPGTVPIIRSYKENDYNFLGLPRQVSIFVPIQYQQMNAAELTEAIADITIRSQLAAVLDRRADALDGILIFAASIAAAVVLWYVLALHVHSFRTETGQRRAAKFWKYVQSEWRSLAVFASVMWGVSATLIVNPNESAEFALVVGPFVISVACYLLFPKPQSR